MGSMCRVLGVSRSGFYAWKKRPISAAASKRGRILKAINQVYVAAKKRYGYLRVHQQLRRQGTSCGRHLVARLMRDNQLVGLHKRRARKPRNVGIGLRDNIAANVLQRKFTAERPNQIWVADFTYLPVAEGWLFFAAVIDIFSRRVVGWSFSQQADEKLVTDALEMALQLRKPAAGMIHHCDQGSQYTAIRYGAKLAEHGLVASMSRKGNCHDNAVAESFFSSLKRELETEMSVKGRGQTQEMVHEYVEKFYNRIRLHSTLGFLSPAEYELARFA